jgi:hypothetical protein
MIKYALHMVYYVQSMISSLDRLQFCLPSIILYTYHNPLDATHRPAFSAKAFLMNGVTVQLPISAFTLKRRKVMTYSQA